MAYTPHLKAADDAFKGVVITGFLAWFRENLGEPRMARAFSRLTAPDALPLRLDHLTFGILPSAWYGALPVHAMVEALLEDIPPAEQRQIALRAGRQVFLRLVSGIYAGLYRAMATPSLYVRYAPRLWSSSYRLGRLQVGLEGAGEVRVVMLDWPGHHPFLCDLNWATAAPIFEGMGCLEVEVERPCCIAQGAGHCELRLSYLAGM